MSFRKYGGTQFASSHNIVKSNVNTTDSFYVTKNVGQPNTYINFESDISGNVNIYGDLDVSGNLIVSGDADINGKLHVQENIDCSGNVNVDGDVTASKMFLTAPNHNYLDNEVVPKSYVNSVAVGLKPLAPCNLCSNEGIISLSGPQTIDGIPTTNGMRVLVNAQGFIPATPTTPASNPANFNNGIYVVDTSGPWTRATDLVIGDEATGTAMLILQGTTYADYRFVCSLGSNTSPVFIGTNPVTNAVLWTVFDTPFKLGQGLNKEPVGTNTVINVDSSLNFINFLDNSAGPNAGTINIGKFTPIINIGVNNPASLINTINLANVAASGQQSALNWGTSSNSGDLTFRGGTFNLYATGDYNQDSGTIFNTNIDTSKTTGNLNIGTGNSQTGPINLGTGTGAKTITIGSAASTVAVNGTTTITGTTNITGGITASGLITASAGILTNTLQSTGVIYIDGLINANAGIITGAGTTITSNGPITSSGLITANAGLTVTGTTNINTTGSSLTSIGNAGTSVAVNGTTTILGTTNINNSGSSSTNIGNLTGTTNFTGNVGIGTSTPQYPLDVSGNLQVTSGTSNTNPSVIIIKDPGTAANFPLVWQHQAQLQVQNSNAASMVLAMSDDGVGIIQGATINVGYNNICLNPYSTSVSPANVGIGTFTPQFPLDVTGIVNATSYKSASDYRIKKDVIPLDDSFTVDKLRPVTYNNTKLDKQDIGLIAHELQEIYPFLVNGEKDGEHFQSVNYTGLIGILIKEIQDLKERVKKLENPSS
jgi:cytoskeletal protein CcmA (bactofilin family)